MAVDSCRRETVTYFKLVVKKHVMSLLVAHCCVNMQYCMHVFSCGSCVSVCGVEQCVCVCVRECVMCGVSVVIDRVSVC